MKTAPKTRRSAVYVVCVNNAGYPAALELHKIYRAMTDTRAAADGYLRVIDESGEDYLYAKDRFVAVDLPMRVKRSVAAAQAKN